MILSHKHQFIFIKTTKTAGTSIEVYLSKFCGHDDVLTPIYPSVDPHRARNYRGFFNPFRGMIQNRGHGLRSNVSHAVRRIKYYNHIPAKLVRHRLSPQIWDQYFKFCVERNPFDKTLSHYHMVNERQGGGLTFDEYLLQDNFCLNYPKYTDQSGRVIVDKVLRYESLSDDLRSVFDRLGISFEGELGVRAKSEYRRDRTPYQDVYTPLQRKRVEEAFTKEIELHGYRY